MDQLQTLPQHSITYHTLQHARTPTNTEKKDNNMNLVTKCCECIHRQSVPGDTHTRCAAPDPRMKGDPHGIEKGWFFYPLNFDPIWRTRECVNYTTKDPVKNAQGADAFAKQTMQDAAALVACVFGGSFGFVLIVTPFGGPGLRGRHISNMKAESVVSLVQEYAEHLKSPEDVTKHSSKRPGELMPVYLSTTIEHPNKKTLWLNFDINGGVAKLNLNNIANSKDSLVGGKMLEAIAEYLKMDAAEGETA